MRHVPAAVLSINRKQHARSLPLLHERQVLTLENS